MSKELNSRISALLQSTSQRNNRRRSNSQNEGKQEVSDNSMSQGHSSTTSMTEKTVTTTILDSQSRTGRQPNSQEEFHDVSLDIDHTHRHEYQRNRGHQRVDQPTPTPTLNVFPPTDDIVPMVNMSASSSRINLSHTQAKESSYAPNPLPPFTHPSMATIDIYGSRDPSNFNPPLNRLTALSFYDDLLKSINSERMMYATSYSNPSGSQEQLVHDGQLLNKKASIDSQSPSIALCSSIPLTYSTGSEIDDRLSSDQPIHPFDATPTSQPQETLIPRTHSSELRLQETDSNMERIYIHPMDIMSLNGGLEINLTPQQESHHSRDRSSKCGSSHSQETIENWRIHVAPSSPTIPAIDHDMEDDLCATPTPIPRKNGPHALQLTPTDKNGYLFAKDSYEHNNNRQGSIPIILSAQLQHQAEQYLDDDDLYFSAADLHIPRPSYAYGQSRTQRQGSVNSSIGGYNYSTAASSPSLADSLSNPMYHQQSLAMNVSMGPRPFPLRKGSLPSSINSSLIDDGLSRGGPQQHYFQTGLQQSNSMHQPHSQHANFPAIPTRMRPRTPSHLSNMVNGNNMSDHTVKNSAQNTSPQEKPRSHYRSHSHHIRSSSSHNTDSQWGSFGELKEAQTGFTTTVDIPPTSMSHIDYQSHENDAVVRSSVGKANMSLQEALAIDEQQFRATGSYENTNQYRASRGPYRGPNVPDHLVHPLDLSPLLSHSQGGRLDYNYQNQHYMQSLQQQHAVVTSEAQTWSDACVGLGLIMNNNSQFQLQHQHMSQSNTQYCDPTPSEQGYFQQPIPIPLQREHIQSDTPSNDYDYPMTYFPPPSSSYPEHHYHRPDMVSRMTSNATTLTHHSDRTHASSYSEATSVTTTNPPASHSRTIDYDKRHQVYIQGGEPRRSTSQSTHQGSNALHRQPSQRNKKNLVVAIVPSAVY
ncbi:hypothetical protein MVEG_00394 [Podila verticillata NRRL 6337]|nr:hypothetical protein MVEG_00394 [Podila verticillata NRRL 6337]